MGGGSAPAVPLSAPSGFTFTGPYAPTVSRTGSGTSSTFTTDYSEATRKALITPVQTIYVRLAGNNSNDGLSVGNAIRSLDLAVAMANAYATATKINYEADLVTNARIKYRRTASQSRAGAILVNGVNLDASYFNAWTATIPAVDIIWEPSVANGVADSMLDTTTGWPAQASTADANIWRTSGAVGPCILDYTNLDDYGAPIRLAQLLTTPADTSNPWPEMNALWTLNSGLSKRGGGTYNTGVFYDNGTNRYTRTWDNRNVNGDANMISVPEAGAASCQLRASTTGGSANRRYYMEGLGLIGGANGALYITGDNAFRVRADLVRGRFIGGYGAGAVTMTSIASSATNGVDVVAVGCQASGGKNDGWNAHFACSLVTINCAGDWNGWQATNINNGWTIHETTTAIDVNGSYRNNQDRSVHHVHESLSWGLGTEAGTRRGADASVRSADFAVNGEGNTGSAKLWLDNPKLFDGPAGAPQYRYTADSASTLFYANAAVTPSGNPGTGTFSAYTP